LKRLNFSTQNLYGSRKQQEAGSKKLEIENQGKKNPANSYFIFLLFAGSIQVLRCKKIYLLPK